MIVALGLLIVSTLPSVMVPVKPRVALPNVIPSEVIPRSLTEPWKPASFGTLAVAEPTVIEKLPGATFNATSSAVTSRRSLTLMSTSSSCRVATCVLMS